MRANTYTYNNNNNKQDVVKNNLSENPKHIPQVHLFILIIYINETNDEKKKTQILFTSNEI